MMSKEFVRVSPYEIHVGDMAIVVGPYDHDELRLLPIVELERERAEARAEHECEMERIEERNRIHRERRERVARHVSAQALREWDKRQAPSYKLNRMLKKVWTSPSAAESMHSPFLDLLS